MPSDMKWYDSKQYIRDTPGVSGLPVKCFEYIVQGLKRGVWEIPAQHFTYFDVTQAKYKTLTTEPLKITIKGNGGSSAVAQTQSPQEGNKLEPQEAQLPLNTWSSWRPVHQRPGMSWILFFLLAFLPVAWLLWQLIRFIILHQAHFFQQKYAFKVARKQIKQAAARGRPQDLHTIFIDLFAQRLGCAPSLVSPEIIDQAFSRAGQSEQLQSWEQFYTRVYEAAFYATSYTEQQKTNLFEQASQWVTKLEKIL